MGNLDDFMAAAERQPSFNAIRAMRDKALTLEEQRRLALEDRRAFAREYVQDYPVTGTLAMLLLPPAEQAYKGLQHLRGREVGRSGFFAPAANIGAAYTGIAEGLATRWRRK